MTTETMTHDELAVAFLHASYRPPKPRARVDRYIEEVARVKAKPEVGIQFGAGGATTPDELAHEGTRDVGYAIDLARRCPEG